MGLSEHQTRDPASTNSSDPELELPLDIISGLPAEIYLNVLSNLPAKEIQRIRAVSKHFRNLVDEPSNNSSLSSTIIAREQARIQASVSGMLTPTLENYS